MTTPRDPNKAIEWMVENAEPYADAKANVSQIEHFMKTKRAMLMAESDGKTVADRENAALSHPDYIQLIHGLRAAVYEEARLKTLLKAAELRVEVWRSENASARREGRAMQ
jgi:post-segregation antitoxin (ccd killing protein)